MGVVWLANDESLGEEVALKFLPEAVRMDASAVDELKRETRKSRRLAHQNVVRIYDYVEDERSAAISMEYVDGMTLSEIRIQQENKIFMPSHLEGLLMQLADALAYAHETAKIVHRDLKPANLMLNSKSQLRVTDFGISSSITDSVSRVSIRRGSSGSPPYMSPQQVLGEASTVADDVYSFGATVFELLTSKPPFYRGNIYEQLRSVVPPSLEARRRELLEHPVESLEPIPDSWELGIASCLAKNPEDRPVSIQAAVHTMLVANPPPPERPPERPTPEPVPPAKTPKALFIMAGAFGVAVLIVLATLFVGNTDKSGSEIVEPRSSPTPSPVLPVEQFAFIAGDVQRPGKVTWTEGLTLQKALDEVGGPNVNTEAGKAVITRDGTETTVQFGPGLHGSLERLSANDAIRVSKLTVPASTPKTTPAANQTQLFVNSQGNRFLPAGSPGVLFSEYETKVSDFEIFSESTGNDFTQGVYSLQGSSWSPGAHSWKDPGFPQLGSHPVVGVSWRDALAYCEWLTARERNSGKIQPDWTYRLPTDEEWSLAVGLTGEVGNSPKEKDAADTNFPWGQEWPAPAEQGNIGGRLNGTAPVGSSVPNAYGLKDMFGNAWEWCEDSFEPRRKWKVLRGGSWSWASQDTREYSLSFRYFEEPEARWTTFGFRPVLDTTGSR